MTTTLVVPAKVVEIEGVGFGDIKRAGQIGNWERRIYDAQLLVCLCSSYIVEFVNFFKTGV